jgi:hypothetical protein
LECGETRIRPVSTCNTRTVPRVQLSIGHTGGRRQIGCTTERWIFRLIAGARNIIRNSLRRTLGIALRPYQIIAGQAACGAPLCTGSCIVGTRIACESIDVSKHALGARTRTLIGSSWQEKVVGSTIDSTSQISTRLANTAHAVGIIALGTCGCTPSRISIRIQGLGTG